jgi:hypothetical protein
LLHICVEFTGLFYAGHTDYLGGTVNFQGLCPPGTQNHFDKIRVGCHYHAGPLFARYGILKVGDLYQQQLMMHAWKFHNDWLPDCQAAMLARVGESHSYESRAACSGLVVSTGDHRMVGYRVPTEWVSPDGGASVAGFKRSSKGDFLVQYGAFQCGVAVCWVCGH